MKKITLFVAEVACFFVLPLIIIFAQFGKIHSPVIKIGMAGIVLAVFVLLLFKRFFINKKIEQLTAELINYKSDYKTETDPVRKDKIKKAMVFIKTVIAAYNAVMPVIYLGIGWAVAAGLEAQLVLMSATIKYIVLCYVAGGAVSIYKARL